MQNLPICLILIDQLLKRQAIILENYSKSFYLLSFELTKNKGVGFSLLESINSEYLIILATILVIIFAFSYLKSSTSKTEKLAWQLIIAGGFSNLLDRLIFGYVIDFIKISSFCGKYSSIFNFADIYITVGIILLIYLQFNYIRIAYNVYKKVK